MRQAFVDTLMELAEERDDIVLLCGDLGYSVLERFRDRFPRRFFNLGVAEQNMMGAAAGIAASGKIVLTYSIANFAITRCLEQFRNDVCYHGLGVIAVSVGAGTAYGTQGYTHHGIEDVAFTRSLPNVAVISPGDPLETRWALRTLVARGGPASLRLGRGGEPIVHKGVAINTKLEECLQVRALGADVTFLSSGAVLPEAMGACEQLAAQGIDAGLLSMPVVEPLDRGAIERAARHSRLLISVEEHVTEGGFGGAVAEIIAGMAAPRAQLMRTGIARNRSKLAASQSDIRRQDGFDAESLTRRTIAALTAKEGA